MREKKNKTKNETSPFFFSFGIGGWSVHSISWDALRRHVDGSFLLESKGVATDGSPWKKRDDDVVEKPLVEGLGGCTYLYDIMLVKHPLSVSSDSSPTHESGKPISASWNVVLSHSAAERFFSCERERTLRRE